ncbi:sensor histidine kinase [Alicyclobacillus shizuokensis]|uniref:sensor histidine kinase n=1 Tax=Alicyclobacillus shizuokensis TaxID=392014 RepID=UPI000834C653|nr:HAMP domain-containing sensor histidine kinase [Alicyclobacillus shizuokensis]
MSREGHRLRVRPRWPAGRRGAAHEGGSRYSPSALIVVLYIALVLAWAFAAFSLAFFVTQYGYRWLHYRASGYVVHMTMVGVGIVLFVGGGLVMGRRQASKQRLFFQSLLDAMRRMAKGDFNVRVDVELVTEPGGRNHPFRQLVHSVNTMAEELAQLEEVRQEFISNVSHEIQSPLTSITGFVQALKDDRLPPSQRRHYLDIIEAESRRLSRLSDNLLKLTMLESGQHSFHPQRYRLDKQIRSVVLTCEPLWLKKQIAVDVSLPPTYITADEDLLSQVWMNLLANAIKFTGENGRIDISLQRDGDWAEMRITDTGIGIAEEDLPRIFERFFKADKSRSAQKSGGGLGLAIVNKILSIHKGQITVQSRLGAGTTFTVRLPQAESAQSGAGG